MTDYVIFETLFSHAEDRTIENLSSLYMDEERLQSVVHRLISKVINKTVISGKSVLLKPNWVRHDLKENDFICLRTNDNLLLCVLEEVLSLSPSRVLIADAPIQSCDWDRMLSEGFMTRVHALSQRHNIPISIKDFRRTINDTNNKVIEENVRPLDDYVIFDLGDRSYLEPITTTDNRFRVTSYNPDRMAEVHHKGTHKYCIAKDVFDYDVIITIPKLKTHRMAGMTNSLKLLIGINGDKDFLPHHRIGSVLGGHGDNYLNSNALRSIASAVTDLGNKHRGTVFNKYMLHLSSALWELSRPDKATLANAGWYGNDTIWRTVMDVNTIALHGDNTGHIHPKTQRRLLSIMDGIIGGQGDGPLHPEPSPLGIVAISDNPYLLDVVAAHLYHLNISKIPLINAAQQQLGTTDYTIIANSQKISMEDVSSFGIDIKLSPGWADYDN